MESIFENFMNENLEISSNVDCVNTSLSFWGSIKIQKGALSIVYEYNCNSVYEHPYITNYCSLDDYDFHTEGDVTFKGVPIDDLYALKSALENAGLKTIAKSLDISDEEKRVELAKQIEKSADFISKYGTSARLMEALTNKMQEVIKLTHIIDNYEDCIAKRFTVVARYGTIKDEEGKTILPTKEELVEQLTLLTK